MPSWILELGKLGRGFDFSHSSACLELPEIEFIKQSIRSNFETGILQYRKRTFLPFLIKEMKRITSLPRNASNPFSTNYSYQNS